MSKTSENLDKKIEAQLEKLKQLKAQKQAIEARERAKQKEQDRKDDTRRKILLGSYLIKKMESNEANKQKILADLNEYLTEDRDRKPMSFKKGIRIFCLLSSVSIFLNLAINGFIFSPTSAIA